MHKHIARIKQHFKSADPLLFKIIKEMELKLFETGKDPARYFHELCEAIISQQLAGKAANAIIKRFTELFKGKAITPARVAAIQPRKFRAIGMSWAKARYVHDLAEKISTKEVKLKNLAELGNEEVILELTKVKGIGRWTAEMFLIFTLGREDVFSFGDLGLRNGFEHVYGKRHSKNQKSMEKIAERWSPYRSYASLALWHTQDSKKK